MIVAWLPNSIVRVIYVKKAEKPPLSPLPVRRAHATSPRKVSNSHSVYVSPHKRTAASVITPQSRLLYCFNRSPARVRHYSRPVLYIQLTNAEVTLDSLPWFCQRHGGMRHFPGAPPGGAVIHKFELCWDFCTMHQLPSFIILCLIVWMLSS